MMFERLNAADQRLARLLALRTIMNSDHDVPTNKRVAKHLMGELTLTEDEITKADSELIGRAERRARLIGSAA
jgi:hypothetical protein